VLTGFFFGTNELEKKEKKTRIEIFKKQVLKICRKSMSLQKMNSLSSLRKLVFEDIILQSKREVNKLN